MQEGNRMFVGGRKCVLIKKWVVEHDMNETAINFVIVYFVVIQFTKYLISTKK